MFSRVSTEELLKDVTGYNNFSIIPYIHAWAHAAANVMLPLRGPGKSIYFPEGTNETS